jgi:hypothetical protein
MEKGIPLRLRGLAAAHGCQRHHTWGKCPSATQRFTSMSCELRGMYAGRSGQS